MTNSYDVAHGLSQVHPGPEEPVEIAQQDDTLARTGNTARDQEMYAAGIRIGEENAKHNAAIRAATGWLPIESAPKDGQSILGRGPRQDTVVIAWDEWAQPEARWKAVHLDVNGYECPEIVLRGEPTLWQPMPAPPCPTCNDQGAVGNILTAQPCPDCAAPGVSTVDDEQDFDAWLYLDQTQREPGDMNKAEIELAREAFSAGRRKAAPAAGDALDALRELVECDSLKKRIASMQVCILETDDDVQELDAMMSDLARRQPAAWDAARAALAAQRKGDA